MRTVRVAIGIICESADTDRVLAVRRKRCGSHDLWEFPGGKIERGETAEQACVRELEEELHVHVGDLRDIYTVEYSYPKYHLSMRCFLCTIKSGCLAMTEQIEIRWVERASLSELCWLAANSDLIEVLQSCSLKSRKSATGQVEHYEDGEVRGNLQDEMIRRRAATRKTMQANKRSDTKPELLVRKRLRKAGLTGYRLQWRDAPGRPDIAFPGRRIAIFVNGCFWHRCPHCNPGVPKHNVEFWQAKFRRNIERDARAITELRALGWQAITIWECELADARIEATMARVIDTIRNARRSS
ncbi:DNA mismatch endonuclease Vsr [Coriobacterium glomerans PW2]|uniref:8-oxo-dGTP diphosphatase n=1 Tax=Coriobacterium glomerans (strain ATCC 49209 / DSM 20642 / JCM 10262 / PW2) TaxID=700015 RepID=F2NB07_CORGP|nr:DNA mismatch endonuclease Vsr [Coriobacterium glomerans PW2]